MPLPCHCYALGRGMYVAGEHPGAEDRGKAALRDAAATAGPLWGL